MEASKSSPFWVMRNSSETVSSKEGGTKSCLFLPLGAYQSFLTLSLQVLTDFHRLNRCDSWALAAGVDNKRIFSLS